MSQGNCCVPSPLFNFHVCFPWASFSERSHRYGRLGFIPAPENIPCPFTACVRFPDTGRMGVGFSLFQDNPFSPLDIFLPLSEGREPLSQPALCATNKRLLQQPPPPLHHLPPIIEPAGEGLCPLQPHLSLGVSPHCPRECPQGPEVGRGEGCTVASPRLPRCPSRCPAHPGCCKTQFLLVRIPAGP